MTSRSERLPGTTLAVPPCPVQTSLLDENQCPACGGAGRRALPETGAASTCRVCQGAGNVPYDPTDHSEIPF